MPRPPDAVFDEIRNRRGEGVRAGLVEATELVAAAAAFRLATDEATYRRIDLDEAQRVLVRILHRDLAYDAEIMPMADAERLSSEILLLLPGAQLFTNGSYGSPQDAAANGVKVGPSWNPATEATFDTGVIAVGETVSACVLVEDED